MNPPTRGRRSIRTLSLAIALAAITVPAGAVGISVGYLYPSGGRVATPVSPVALRDLGVNFGTFIGLSSSIVLYNYPSLALQNDNGGRIENAFGQMYLPVGSLVAKLNLPLGKLRLSIYGGGFGTWARDVRQTGELDRALAAELGVDAVSTDLTYEASFGWGWLAGGKLVLPVTQDAGLAIGGHYMAGSIPVTVSGSYVSADSGVATTIGGAPTPLTGNPEVDMSGIEFTIGIEFEL